MADSLGIRVNKLEKAERVKVLPDAIDRIHILEALIFPLYTQNEELLRSHKELLEEWEKRLGKKVFQELTTQLLQRRKQTDSSAFNEGNLQRMREIQKDSKKRNG